MRNLVTNAIDHAHADSTGGSARVVLHVAGDDQAAAIAVRDYGVGLAPGESAMVFNRFWRADPARARTSGGTGLGLSISMEDAHLHGGWLQAWGRPGEGSQFRLTLPRRVAGSLRQSPLAARARGRPGAGPVRRRTALAVGLLLLSGPAAGSACPRAGPWSRRPRAAATRATTAR